MNSGERSFFAKMLGEKSTREVKLTQAFSACFAESVRFRDVVLQLLVLRCRLPRRRVTPASYSCRAEFTDSAGRVDLVLSSEDTTRPTFRLENKIDSSLTAGQMTRYRVKEKRVYLFAITKWYPEVGNEWLRRNGCFALRWQDVHLALGVAKGLRGGDRFICEAFRSYLEDLGMAHPGHLTKKGLLELGRLFAKARGGKRYSGLDGVAIFEAGTLAVETLQDVLRDALDRDPSLRKWTKSRPHYFKWREDGVETDYLAFRLKKDRRHWIGAAFEFSSEGTPGVRWVVQAEGFTSRHIYKRFALPVTADGAVDSHKLLDQFVRITKRFV